MEIQEHQSPPKEIEQVVHRVRISPRRPRLKELIQQSKNCEQGEGEGKGQVMSGFATKMREGAIGQQCKQGILKKVSHLVGGQKSQLRGLEVRDRRYHEDSGAIYDDRQMIIQEISHILLG